MSVVDPQSGLLRAEHVGYVWQSLRESRRAITDVTAEFPTGQTHFICGPSGAGKSTLGLLLSGLMIPTEGTVLWQDKALSAQRRRIAYAFQFPETIFFADTVREELREICNQMPDDEQPPAFEALGISYSELKERHPHLLSEGFARLTALALQMSRDPDLLILDEPTIGLDWKHQAQVISALRDFIKPEKTLIVISHDTELIEALGGTTWIIVDGALAWHGPTDKLLGDPELMKQASLLA